MLSSILPIVLAVVVGDAKADEKAKDELAALGKRVEEAESYTFLYFLEVANPADAPASEVPPPATHSRGGSRRDAWTVEFQRRQPVHFMKGHAEFYRRKEKYVALGRNDEWSPVEPPARGASPRAMERMVAEVELIALPHRLLADLGSKLAETAKQERDGKIVFEAELTADGAGDLAQGGSKKAKSATPSDRGTGGTPAEPATSAPPPASKPVWSGRLHVVAAPASPESPTSAASPAFPAFIEEFELHLVETTGERSRAIDRKYRLSSIGATKVVAPDPALKLLPQWE